MVNDNIGWGDNVRVELGRDSDYWDWENGEESQAYRWRHNVEYVMTEKGLERTNKLASDDEDDENTSDALEQYRRSREQVEKERQQKLQELEQLEKELKAPVDTTGVRPADSSRYRYTPKAKATKLTASANVAEDSFPAGIHNLLMINLP
jgi:hypothetical protein